MQFRSWSLLAGLVMLLGLSGGCASYQLQGKVVEGGTPAVLVVSEQDPRLQQPGLPGAVVDVTLDPGRLNATRVGAGTSDREGHFAIPVDSLGAGLLEYDAEIVAWMAGHQRVTQRLRLPPSARRVLIILPPGEGTAPAGEYDILQETLRMGEPYMR